MCWLLNFSNLPIHSHWLHCHLMLVVCYNWGIHVGDPIIPLWKKFKVHCSPILEMANICTMIQHDPKVKAVRVYGKISEVKQPQDQSNSKMSDHLGSIYFVFFSVAEILGKLGKFAKFYWSAWITKKLNCKSHLIVQVQFDKFNNHASMAISCASSNFN